MRCNECNVLIDPETDRHLLVTEEIIAPDLGMEGADGQTLCDDCMDPEIVRLAPEPHTASR